MAESKKSMELKTKAENMKENRKRSNEIVGILWNKESENEDVQDNKDENNGQTVKEMELIQAAGKMDLKRKFSGKWVALSEREGKESN